MNLNYLKAGLAALCIVCVTLLMAVGAVAAASGMPIITLVVGYCVGNTVSAFRDEPVAPIVKRKKGDT